MKDLARLKWQCRRGMLELDLLLKNYLESRYVLADRAEKAQFSALLKLEDGELLAALQRDWMSAERSK
ncbi:MAG: succinate dehydrogenase assembly factor 2 [Methylovulum sp.]|nr:MAG: succinate dehydrogenase assembly factor 2 [Methylovulum sp.]